MKKNKTIWKILIADDHRENLLYLKKILSMHEYDVAAANSGDEAWTLLQVFRPDMALLDVHMPGLNGYELCEKIKANVTTREIPVMFISAYHETTDKVKGFEVGGVDYIEKPIQPNELLSRVHTHLNLSRIGTELREKA